MFGNAHDIIKRPKALLHKFRVLNIQLNVGKDHLSNLTQLQRINTLRQFCTSSLIKRINYPCNLLLVRIVVVALVEHLEKGDELVF
jgi:hypothetical protein